MCSSDLAEVIFGTVIDPDMGDELRVTVIATGFDTARPKGERVRRTVKLGGDDLTRGYKGEDNLKYLDTPAYERRTPPVHADEEEDGDRKRSANVRRLRADDFKKRNERIRKDDSDIPAFLRKMMD